MEKGMVKAGGVKEITLGGVKLKVMINPDLPPGTMYIFSPPSDPREEITTERVSKIINVG